jgi:hypothetical protein
MALMWDATVLASTAAKLLLIIKWSSEQHVIIIKRELAVTNVLPLILLDKLSSMALEYVALKDQQVPLS